MAKVKTKPKPSKPPEPLPVGTEELLGIADVCRALKVCRDHFRKMRSAGEYPPPDRVVGGGPRWRITTHNTWVRGENA